ncbi:hypothetical protein V6N11_064281 [Hibiscus sabdariffa]|uniref:Uncharacterized protein n=1 Tax=Hibiscus sabdariffa TaxID=183260 RepID=A0ABR2PNH6_9ROSI
MDGNDEEGDSSSRNIAIVDQQQQQQASGDGTGREYNLQPPTNLLISDATPAPCLPHCAEQHLTQNFMLRVLDPLPDADILVISKPRGRIQLGKSKLEFYQKQSWKQYTMQTSLLRSPALGNWEFHSPPDSMAMVLQADPCLS